MKSLFISLAISFVISLPAVAQTNNPWQAPYQAPEMMRGMNHMSPQQMQEMQRQRHEAMMQRRAMRMQDKGTGDSAGCQPGSKGMKGHHGGHKHGKKHGQKHQAHRQQMEQRLDRIEKLLQQLVDQQASKSSAPAE